MSTDFLISGYDHGGILLNVSGTCDEDECQIGRITAADSAIDLYTLFDLGAIIDMEDSIYSRLEREARQEAAEARAEQRQWHREFAIASV